MPDFTTGQKLGFGSAGAGGLTSALTSIIGGGMQREQYKFAAEQARLENAERGTQRAQMLNEIIGQQTAMAAAKGIAPGSSIFRQVSQKSFDAFHQDQEVEALNLSFKEADLKSKLAASRLGDFASVIGGIAETGLAIAPFLL